MSTPTEIINLGFREANFTAIAASPSTDEAGEGLVILQNLVRTLFSNVANIKPVQWYIPSPQANSSKLIRHPALTSKQNHLNSPADINHPPSNVRLMMKNITAETVFFQYQPEDGALMEYVDVGHTADVILDSNGALFGLTGFIDSITISKPDADTRLAPRKWVYRADLGSWIEIVDLVAGVELPFPSHFDDYFITAMAIRLAPRFGSPARAETRDRHRDMEGMIRQQYYQMKEAIFEGPYLASQNYRWYGMAGDPNRGFI